MRLMKSVARRVTLGLCETKRFAIINLTSGTPASAGASQYWYTSPFAALVNGTASGDIIGSEIVSPMMKMKFKITIPWNSLFAQSSPVGTNYSTVSLFVALIASNEDNIASTAWSNFSPTSTPYYWMYQADADKPTFNGNNVKVLRMWKRTVTPDQLSAQPNGAGNQQVIKGRLMYRWKRKVTYEDIGNVPGVGAPPRSGNTKGYNYHVVYAYGMRTTAGSVTIGDWPRITSDMFMYYKDP